jgi:hypothetical protein
LGEITLEGDEIAANSMVEVVLESNEVRREAFDGDADESTEGHKGQTSRVRIPGMQELAARDVIRHGFT